MTTMFNAPTVRSQVVRANGEHPILAAVRTDVDHEYNGMSGALEFADITASLYVHYGDGAIAVDFGIYGNVTKPSALATQYAEQENALNILIGDLQALKDHLRVEYQGVQEAMREAGNLA